MSRYANQAILKVVAVVSALALTVVGCSSTTDEPSVGSSSGDGSPSISTSVDAGDGDVTDADASVSTGPTDPGSNTDQDSDESDEPDADSDDDIIAQLQNSVPAEYRESGTLKAAYSQYAPFGYIPESGDQTDPYGAGVDLFESVGRILGLEVEWSNVPSDQTVIGLQRDQFVIKVSPRSYTPEMLEEALGIDIVHSGSALLTLAGNPDNVVPAEYCGLAISTTAGISIATTELPAASEQCEAEGKKPIEIVALQSLPESLQALISGRSVGMVNDIISAKSVEAEDDRFEVVGDLYNPKVLAFSMKKDSDLAPVIRDTLQYLMNTGELHDILDRYNIADLAVDCIAINQEERSPLCN